MRLHRMATRQNRTHCLHHPLLGSFGGVGVLRPLFGRDIQWLRKEERQHRKSTLLALIAKRFGVDPSTVQRISRPFADAAA
jgi:hypothetical protein